MMYKHGRALSVILHDVTTKQIDPVLEDRQVQTLKAHQIHSLPLKHLRSKRL